MLIRELQAQLTKDFPGYHFAISRHDVATFEGVDADSRQVTSHERSYTGAASLDEMLVTLITQSPSLSDLSRKLRRQVRADQADLRNAYCGG